MRWAQQENEEDRRIIGFKLEQQILSNVSLKEKIDIKKSNGSSGACGTLTKVKSHQSPRKRGERRWD